MPFTRTQWPTSSGYGGIGHPARISSLLVKLLFLRYSYYYYYYFFAAPINLSYRMPQRPHKNSQFDKNTQRTINEFIFGFNWKITSVPWTHSMLAHVFFFSSDCCCYYGRRCDCCYYCLSYTYELNWIGILWWCSHIRAFFNYDD